jgi:hypothetical protein
VQTFRSPLCRQQRSNGDRTMYRHGGKEGSARVTCTGTPFQDVRKKVYRVNKRATKDCVNCIRYNSRAPLPCRWAPTRVFVRYEGKTLALIHKLEDDARRLFAVPGPVTIIKCDGVRRRNKAVQCCRRRQASEVHTWKPAEAQVGKPFDRVPVGGTAVGLACFINAIFLFPSV